MFTIPGQENPLDLLISYTGSSLVQNKLAQNAEMDRMKKIERATSGLNENSSDIDWLKALNNIPREDQASFLKIHENIAKGRKAERKVQETKAEKDKVAKEESERSKLLAKKYGIPEEDVEGLKPADVAALGRHRNKGGVSSQPIAPEISSALAKILRENPQAGAEEIQILADEAGIPRSVSNSSIETRRRQDEKSGKRKEIISGKRAEADIAYQNELPAKIESLDKHKEVTARFKQLSKEGATGKPYEKILEKAGLINLTSSGRREAGSLQKEYTKEFRQILGSQMSAQEFFTLLNAYPNPDFSDAQNQAIISNYEIWDDLKQKEVDIANKMIEDNGGDPPENFALKVKNEVSKYAKMRIPEMRRNAELIKKALQSDAPKGTVIMFDEEGNILYVPKAQVEDVRKQGAILP